MSFGSKERWIKEHIQSEVGRLSGNRWKENCRKREEKKACRDGSHVVFGPGGKHSHTLTHICTDDSKWNTSTKGIM